MSWWLSDAWKGLKDLLLQKNPPRSPGEVVHLLLMEIAWFLENWHSQTVVSFHLNACCHFSHAWIFAILWIIAHQAPLSMGFSRQEYWSELPCPSPPGFVFELNSHCFWNTSFWQNVVHWRREWQTTSVFLPWEPHEQYEKAKWQDTERGTPQVRRGPKCYWRSVEK